jgi:NAD-dependent SIR2 family protein deacetylase
MNRNRESMSQGTGYTESRGIVVSQGSTPIASLAHPSVGDREADASAIERLAVMIRTNSPLTLLCGAGCSTASGIPDYRDATGAWKQRQPMQFREFMSHEGARRRYWARSMVGWPRFSAARPNDTHRALAELERRGYVHSLIAQNVDDLHRRAGQQEVIDLHGRLAQVICLECGSVTPRRALQQRLVRLNREYWRRACEMASRIATAADGDAMLDGEFKDFSLAYCAHCDGVLKPHVVFFGEVVPRPVVERAFAAVSAARMLLVVGSSLMVYSGYRFCRAARQRDIPIAIVNRGRTRADADADLKLDADCAAVLTAVLRHLPSTAPIT